MRKLFFMLLTLLSTTAFSQDLSKDIQELQRQAAKQRAELDSMQKASDSLFAVRMKISDSIEMARFNEQNTRNLNSFVAGMKEREQKQKKAMWMRLIFGGVLLGVGIFAMLRKRKKKEAV
jgi:uncharacterized protein YlxW (UPF0749 family)